jgi:hypothetical protein
LECLAQALEELQVRPDAAALAAEISASFIDDLEEMRGLIWNMVPIDLYSVERHDWHKPKESRRSW